MLYYLV